MPRGERELWTYELPDNPFAFDRQSSDYPNLVPVIHGDRVYVTTTRNVVCLDAFEGDELWRSSEPPGWAPRSSRGTTPTTQTPSSTWSASDDAARIQRPIP